MRTTRHATSMFVTVVTLTLASFTSVGFATQLYNGFADLKIDITKIPAQNASVLLNILSPIESNTLSLGAIGSVTGATSAFINGTPASTGQTQLAEGDGFRLFASASGEATAGLVGGSGASSLVIAQGELMLVNESANAALFSIAVDGVAFATTSFIPSVTLGDVSLLFSTVRVRDADFGSILGATTTSDSETRSGVTTQNISDPPIDTDVPFFNNIFTDIEVGPNSTLMFELTALLDGSASAVPPDEANPVVIPDPSTVPEPIIVALLGVGLVGLAGARIRRKQFEKG